MFMFHRFITRGTRVSADETRVCVNALAKHMSVKQNDLWDKNTKCYFECFEWINFNVENDNV